jgi:hypothetical protein
MAVKLTGNPAAAYDGITQGVLVFVVADNGAMYQLSQVAPNDGWSSWQNRGSPQGVTLLSSPTVSLNNFIDLVAVNPLVIGADQTDQSLYSLPQHDGGGAWSGPRGSSLVPSPAVSTVLLNGLQVPVAVGVDGVLQSQDPGSGQWSPHPGVRMRPTPTIGRSQDGRFEIFAVGADGQALWHIWQIPENPDVWSDWFSHGAPPGVNLRGSPSLGADQDSHLQLFVVGTDGALWHIWQVEVNDGWSDWFSHGAPPGGTLQGSPSLGTDKDGFLHVFVVGTDGTTNGVLWHIWQSSEGWSDWLSHGAPHGVTLQGSVCLAPNQARRLELFVVGDTDGALWHIWQFDIPDPNVPEADVWSDWFSHGTP